MTEPLSQPLVPLPRQKRVLERLQLVGPGPAAFYADALRMLRSGDSLECLTHLVSHCHREIESALKDVLLPDGLPKEEREQGQKSKDTHKREVQAVLAALRIDESESLAKLWLRIATREDEDALHRAAHRNALDAPRPFDAAFRTRCSELEALFEKLTLKEIFQLFRTFTPRPRFDGPFASRDGLSRELTKVIAKAPQLFAEAGMRFVEHAPPYVRALVEGLTEAVRAKLVFEWAPVLELSEWVLEQPTGEVLSLEQALDLGEDPGWTWTRMAVCRLLVAGLAEGPSTLPAVHDARVLRMLETLLAAADDSTMRDPLEHAMNTIRGTAAEGLLRWTLRQGGDVGGERFVASGASVLLERMLSAEPSVGPRAMVGVYLPYLIALDAAWVRAHYELLFPHEPGAGSARSAVWNTFVQRRDPDLASFRMLQAEYEREVRELAGFRGDKRRMEALVRHLVALYWSGHVPLDGGLLDRFYANADVSERQEVIKHIGACFFHTDGEIPRPMLERVCLLWERRLAAATTRPSPEGAAEVAEFGWWFASAKFDQGWSMAQLALVLDLTDEVELEYAVAERLGVLAEGAPSDAIRLLARLMARAKDWSAIACRRGIESTVRAVLASPEADAHAMARDLVGRLTARGHAEFLSLISP